MNRDAIITDTAPAPQEKKMPSPPKIYGARFAILSGVLLWLSHPPVGLFPLAWFALAPLLVGVLQAKRLRQAFGRGYLFSLVFLGLTCHWIGLTIVDWVGSAIGWLAWAALVPILSLYYGAWAGLTWWLSRPFPDSVRLLIAGVMWVAMEYIRTLGSLTMPWAQVSYSQFRFLPLLQFVELTGAYGLSLLLLLLNGGIAYWWWWRRRENNPQRWAALYGFLTLFLALVGLARLQVPPPNKTVHIAVMQGNFETKSSAYTEHKSLLTLLELTDKAGKQKPTDLILWSETAFPYGGSDFVLEQVKEMSRRHQVAILGGSTWRDSLTGERSNSALLLTPDGKQSHSEKQQRVPFGEFIPFRPYWPPALVKAFDFPPDDLSQGAGIHPLTFTTAQGEEVRTGAFICYESMYPRYARLLAHKGANLLVTISNDRWFQGRPAMEQHLSAVVLRAVENRRDIMRSTTNGITCAIDSTGRIRAEAPMNNEAILHERANLREGMTLYTRFGDWLPILCLVGLFGLAVLRIRGAK
jgi:apolipoprotein N-acyltransferase